MAVPLEAIRPLSQDRGHFISVVALAEMLMLVIYRGTSKQHSGQNAGSYSHIRRG